MAPHRGRRPAGAVLALTLASAGLSGVVLAGPAGADGTEGVTICHAAGNSGRWVVITVDSSALASKGHRAHQGERDVIPPFEHTAESGATTTLEGQNWADGWPVDSAGRATGAVEVSDCGAAPARKAPQHQGQAEKKQPGTSAEKKQRGTSGEEKQPGKSGERGSKATPGGTGPGSTSPSGAADTQEPNAEEDARPALVGGGLALLLAGGATAVGVTRRRS